MAVIYAKKIADISASADARKAIIEAVGDLSGIEIMFNHILVGTHIRNKVTKGGIHLPDATVQEDEFQSKVGLVLKKGPMAFVDDESNQFFGQDVAVGDWIVYRVGDGWSMHINKSPCRLLADNNIRMKIQKPDAIL